MQVERRIANLPLSALRRLQQKLKTSHREAGDETVTVRLVPADRPATLPLSFAQARLWLLEHLHDLGPAYTISALFRFEGDLDRPALERALAAVEVRHEAVRTRFVQHGGEPAQLVDPPGRIRLDFTDLSQFEGSAQAEGSPKANALRAHEHAAERLPFDLQTGPLLRADLLRLGPSEHLLLLTMHHIVADGWSLVVMAREIDALYVAHSTEAPSPLPPLPIQYVDYAIWQRRWLQGAILERQLGYWCDRLANAPATLDLPTDRKRPSQQSFAGAAVPLSLPSGLVGSLTELGRRAGATLFMVLLAGFNAVLSRWSGQTDIVVGTPIAGRTQRETEDVVGLFVNTLALRTDLSGDPTFDTLLSRVQAAALGAYAHQDLPFEKLVEALKPVRDLSRQPLFQVEFAMQNVVMRPLDLTSCTYVPRDDAATTAKFDVTLNLQDGDGRSLRGWLQYATDLFDRTTIERLAGHFVTVLTAAAEDSACRISKLPLLGEMERRQLVTGWNATSSPFADDQFAHVTLSAQAARTPEAVALVYREQSMCYAELERQANRVAHHLQALGVGPDTVVGLAVERSPEMVVGLLGILKAGGAYLPLDLSHPAERMAYMLDHAGTALIVTHGPAGDKVPQVPGMRRVLLDGDAAAIAAQPVSPPSTGIRPDNLAYVIYTSGSTGQPKGVLMPHRPLSNLLAWSKANGMNATPGTTLQVASVGFDSTFLEIFTALQTGSRLVLIDDEVRRDARLLSAAIREHGVTDLILTPLALQALAILPADSFPRPSTLRHVEVTGDRFECDGTLRAWFGALPAATLDNQYGPAETHVVTSLRLGPAPGDWPAQPSLGRPIANSAVFVLDEHMEPVPAGVAGELYLGGVTSGRGYLRQPGLTAGRFVPNPFAHGERLYKTGDICRLLANGEVAFIGRQDHQVKLRGYRVELGEVTAALLTHPNIRQAAVVTRGNGVDLRLVAYVASLPDAANAAELRRYLAARLPEYMLPSSIVLLDALPLTTNGKLDRSALPDSVEEATYNQGDRRFASAMEHVVATLWEAVLRRDRIGANDNFFDLGGHSLAAIRVLSALQSSVGVTLPLRSLFEAPTVAGFAGRIAAVQEAAQGDPKPHLAARARPDVLPATSAQVGLWLVEQMLDAGSTYAIGFAYRVQGLLDGAALGAAFTEIVRRHEVLRTRLQNVGRSVVQVVGPASRWLFEREDLSGLPRTAQDMAIGSRVDAMTRFDLARDPLFRAALVQLGRSEHVVLASMHHSVSDGWSLDILVHELAALYGAYAAGLPSPLPDLTLQYGDCALWQAECLQGPTWAPHVAYWLDRLAHAPVALDLPTDRRRPTRQQFDGASVPLVLPPGLNAGLAELGRAEIATPFMILLAGFSAVLSRWSGQTDIVIGVPVAGRTQREVEASIGLFVNVLPLRMDLSGDPAFRTLLAHTREALLSALAYQELPFEKMVERLQPVRDPSRHPVFQVGIVLQDVAAERLQLPGLQVDPMRTDDCSARWDLTLFIGQRDGVLHGRINYARSLFDHDTIERMAGHLTTLLAGAVADPECRVSRLPLLSRPERHRLLEEWSTTASPDIGPAYIHDLIAAHADRTPDAAALLHDGRVMSFGELERSANQLAHMLRARGAGPEVLVGVAIERSPEMVVCLLAVLKAGAAFVPLDTAYPRDRLASMLREARLPIVLSTSTAAALLPSVDGCLILLDRDAGSIAAMDNISPRVVLHPANLAYAIYTSGSTGKPKCVAVQHRQVAGYVQSTAECFQLTNADRSLALSTFSFDVVVLDLIMPLSAGASVVIGHTDMAADPAEVIRVLDGSGITFCHMIPSAWRQVVAAGWRGSRELRVVTGIEALDGLFANQLQSLVKDVWYKYGATECTVYQTVVHLPRPCPDGQLPIGRPAFGARMFVLDRGEPVPAGVAGELYTGGTVVTRGYYGQPGLTADRFRPSPFGDGERIYETGDRARWKNDGQLEFLGRLDHQVKVRGFRIELGEIEVALRQVDGVDDAVVIVRDDVAGRQQLVAFVITGGRATSMRSLRSHLQSRLPGYMVPAFFVAIPAFPRHPNGKLDRGALPMPGDRPDDLPYVAPQTPLQGQIADVWLDVLAVRQVGINDNFFELGGHSLLATGVLARLRDSLAIDLPLRVLFEAPTVALLAERILSELDVAAAIVVPPLTRQPRPADLPLSYAQQRLWLLEQFGLVGVAYNLPLVVRLQGALDTVALERALSDILHRHEALRTVFALRDSDPVQIIRPHSSLRLAVTDLSALDDTDRQAALRAQETAEARLPFDLAAGPLFRVRLLRLGAEEHVLLLSMHHIVSDGWSLGLLARELGALYEAFAAGRPSPLPALAVQYADYTVWQRSWLQGPLLDRQIAYWKQRLAGAPATLDLPTDRRRPAVQSYAGSAFCFAIPADLTSSLSQLARAENATLFMVLLAGFNAVLSRWSGQTDVVVGTTVAGRPHEHTEGLLGLFINMLAIRTDLSGDPAFREVVRRVKDAALGAFAHQDLPFERLIDVLQPVRDLSRQPVFQILMTLQNAAAGPLVLPALTVTAKAGDTATTQFDLLLSFREEDGCLEGFFQYATDLFDLATVERLTGNLVTLLGGAVGQPHARLSHLPLLCELERRQLLSEWNETAAPFPADRCVHALLSAQAARSPDAVALAYADRTVSYAQLDRQANQCAQYLQGMGIGPDNVVALAFERSPEMVVGLLGILKAGAAYLPLDPSHPPDRLAYMMSDAGVTVVLTHTAVENRLPAIPGLCRVRLDADAASISALPATAPETTVRPGNLAYVIYTSGSTGKPKGVMIAHASLVNYLTWAVTAFETGAASGSPVCLPISFDMTISSLYLPLLAGATVFLPREGDELGLMRRMLQDGSDLSFIKVTPSHLDYLNDALSAEDLAGKVRVVVAGGEALNAASIRVWRDCAPGTRLINAYGPTETVVACSAYNIDADTPSQGVLSIGRPIANTSMHILDESGNLVPVGVPGELSIGGAGLARGYLARPGLTADKFRPSAFGDGERLYRSGDLARWRADNNIEFLGRLDHQVKVRGFRIEPSEVEAALLDHGAVDAAIVTAVVDARGETSLVAHVHLAHEVTGAALRVHLQSRLPTYMIPAAIVMLPEMPLTHNGKIDRQALLYPQGLGNQADIFVPPATPMEIMIADCWAELLAIDRVGSNDNFFDLGGNSLTAARLAARLSRLLGLPVAITMVFEGPTVAEMAEGIETMQWHATPHAASEPAEGGVEFVEGRV